MGLALQAVSDLLQMPQAPTCSMCAALDVLPVEQNPCTSLSMVLRCRGSEPQSAHLSALLCTCLSCPETPGISFKHLTSSLLLPVCLFQQETLCSHHQACWLHCRTLLQFHNRDKDLNVPNGELTKNGGQCL